MGYLCDNCPSLYNPEQEDQERDLVGYLCEADKDTDRRRLMISDSTISHRSSHSPISYNYTSFWSTTLVVFSCNCFPLSAVHPVPHSGTNSVSSQYLLANNFSCRYTATCSAYTHIHFWKGKRTVVEHGTWPSATGVTIPWSKFTQFQTCISGACSKV